MTDALGQTWTHAYDTRGNRIRSTDPLGRTTRTDYDSRGLPARVRHQTLQVVDLLEAAA